MKFLFIGVVVKSSNCRLIIVFSISIKQKAGKKTESKNKQEKVTAKYIPQKRQEKKLQNVRKLKKKAKKKR